MFTMNTIYKSRFNDPRLGLPSMYIRDKGYTYNRMELWKVLIYIEI